MLAYPSYSFDREKKEKEVNKNSVSNGRMQ